MTRGGQSTHDWSQDASWQTPQYLQEPRPPATPAVMGSLAGLIAVLLVISGIGALTVGRGSGAKPTNSSVIAAAQKATVHAGTAHFSATIALSGPSTFTVTLSGESDFAARSTQMSLSTHGIEETVRLIGGVEYYESSLLTLPAGTHWIKILPQDLGLSASPASAASGDPTEGLQFLGARVGQPMVVGKETVDGAVTTHYSVVLNFETLFAAVGKAESGLSPAFAKGFEALKGKVDLTRIPGDVWLDSSGRVRRFSYSLNLQAGGLGIHELETIDFTDFGAPVHINVPAASDTVPFSAIKDQLSVLPGQIR